MQGLKSFFNNSRNRITPGPAIPPAQVRPILVLMGLLILWPSVSCEKHHLPGFESGETRFPADGVSGGKIVFYPANGEDRFTITNGDLIRILKTEEEGDRTSIFFQAGLESGEVRFVSSSGEGLSLFLVSPPHDRDQDGDGFPDVAEFRTEAARESFRLWFLRIAESQHKKRSAGWNTEERDCSGLIRFAYREAMRKHTREWRNRIGYVVDGNVNDDRPFYYPDVPVLGERIFRTGPGSGMDNFSTFGGARQLALFHTRPVSRNLEDALPGDLLFFHNPTARQYPYHSMILVEKSKKGIFLLYHTGEMGTIKRVEAHYLDPSRFYRPHPSNPDFLGVYRFAILE